ncbi:MAG: hypothetical protein ACOC5D_03150 [Thermoplasmatota archaeon]
MSDENEIPVEEIDKGLEVKIKIAEWFADKKRISSTIEGEVETATDKAVLIKEEWIPKSLIEKAYLL